MALAGFSLLLLLPALLLSIGTLVATRGRAWENELVRELFIGSVITFLLLVVVPLVAGLTTARIRPSKHGLRNRTRG